MNLRRINRPWFVRFHDGEEWENQPGDELEVLAIDGFADECFVLFRSRMRRGWHSRDSVYWYSDRVLEAAEREALEQIQSEADATARQRGKPQ